MDHVVPLCINIISNTFCLIIGLFIGQRISALSVHRVEKVSPPQTPKERKEAHAGRRLAGIEET